MFNIHPNEGVVLFAIVQIILGLCFVAMTFLDNKYKKLKENQTIIQKYLLLLAGVILSIVFIIVDIYLELPESELSSKGMLKSIMGWMGTLGLIITFAIDGTKLDKRVQKSTLFEYLTGKSISYFHLCLVGVGVLFIWLGCDSLFI